MKSHNETDYGDSSLSTSNLDRPSSSMQRANRPPDLDLSTTQSSLHSTMTEKLKMPKHASTPEKFLANQTQDVSLSIRPIGGWNIQLWFFLTLRLCLLQVILLPIAQAITQNLNGSQMIPSHT